MATTILKLNCPDAVGVLARITGRIAAEGGPELADQLEAEGYDRFLAKDATVAAV